MKKNEMIINDENIIKTLKDDVLNRKPQLTKLINLLNVIEENYTISIDGQWGIGKTFFVEQLRYLYRCGDCSDFFKNEELEQINKFKGKYIPVYYNAWENDDHDNVIESLLYNILDVFPKYKKDIFRKQQDFDNILKPVLLNISEKITGGIFKKEYIEKLGSFEELTETIITKEEQKHGLYKLFDLISQKGTRILLIIDELDRCRPDFGVKVLETIKHFYNYKNITCLVVTNNNQLSCCIKKYYGNDFDGYNYLNKMYDTVISLNVNKVDLYKYLETYLNFPNDTHFLREMPYLLIDYYKFNLRECNTFVNMYNIAIKYINLKNDFVRNKFLLCSGIFLPIGLSLKIKNVDELYRYINGNSEKTVLDFLNNIRKIDRKGTYIEWLEEIADLQEGEKLEDKMIKYYNEIFDQTKSGIDTFPIHDAISLLGNLINYEEKEL